MEIINNHGVHKNTTVIHEMHESSLDKLVKQIKLNFLKFSIKMNKQLNIYTELKRQYNCQNNMDDQFICFTVSEDDLGNSTANFLIVVKQNENQLNYFNC